LLIVFIVNTIISKSLKARTSVLITTKIAKTTIVGIKLTYIKLLLLISPALYKVNLFLIYIKNILNNIIFLNLLYNC